MNRKNKTRDAQVKTFPKKVWAIILVLAIILALGTGAYLVVFGGKSDESEITNVFNRFIAAAKKGDISAMTACAPPDRYDDSFLLLFELTEDFRYFIQNGRCNVTGVDLTDDSTMVRSFVEATGLDYKIQSEEDIVIDPEKGEWATLYLTQIIVIDGEKSTFPVYFTMVKYENKWYIGYAQFIGPEETRSRRVVGRFVDALRIGDIEAMRACCAEGILEEDAIPMFGTTGEFRGELESGFYGDLDIDYTNNNTMLHSLVNAIGLDFIVESEQAFVQELEEETAKLYVIQTYIVEGEPVVNSTYFNLVRQDGTWFLTFEDVPNENES